jgi:UDP-N-acetyl-D-mannosaminuronate dehydrogenase
MSLAQKMAAREARVGIIGLGYVGLPLAVEFAKAGFLVTGIDLDRRKAAMINAGTSYVQDVPAEGVRTAGAGQTLRDCRLERRTGVEDRRRHDACMHGDGRAVLLPGLEGSGGPCRRRGWRRLVKLLENTFRMINIGLVNELAVMCDRMGINIWEVIEAAKTKPFGFMPFYPGPGLGGHCIPIDPFYLSWKSRQAGVEARFIELAGHINGHMPEFTAPKIQIRQKKSWVDCGSGSLPSE